MITTSPVMFQVDDAIVPIVFEISSELEDNGQSIDQQQDEVGEEDA